MRALANGNDPPHGQARSRALHRPGNPTLLRCRQVFDADGSFTVPAGVRLLRIRAWGGAGGGAPNGCFGGPGGFAEAWFAAKPGEALTVRVGTGGKAYPNYVGGAPGGGNGGVGGNASGAGGGGFSGVFRGAVAQATALLIAGGGGGSGSTGASRHGGHGGGESGCGGYGGSQGLGGSQSGGGSGGGSGGSTPGTALQGGNGGAASGNYSGGGGGGGYFGGGGGGAGTSGGAAAGGGSGFVSPQGRRQRLFAQPAYDTDHVGLPFVADGWEAGIGQGYAGADGGRGRVIIEW